MSKEDGKGKDKYDLLIDVLGNTTKMSILLLLSRKKKLTVTQMARSIRVTRSNLYHFAGEMVKDGILAEPEVVVMKNHIEKYYSHNPVFWKGLDPAEQDRRLKEGLTPEEGRKLLRSTFLSLSIQYRMYADEFANATDEEMRRVGEEFEKDRLMISVWGVDDDEYGTVVAALKKLLSDLQKESARHPERRGVWGLNSVYLTCLPRIFDDQP